MYYRRIKKHFEDHKEKYIWFGTGLGVAGITCIIMRGVNAGLQRGPESTETSVFIRPLNFLSNRSTTNVVTVIEREGRGHPGYLVRCLNTNEIFSSQSRAANAMGISESNLSSHLKGKFPDVSGLCFERIMIDSP